MSTIDAQCLLVHLLDSDREADVPEQWRHGRCGDLSWRFSDSSNTHAWDGDAVAEATARWFEIGARRPDRIRDLLETHERLLDTFSKRALPPPDVLHHDLRAHEVTAVWNDRKQVLIVNGVGEPPLAAALGD